MIVTTPFWIAIFLVALFLALVWFSPTLADIFKEEEKVKQTEDISGRIARTVIPYGNPSVNLRSCTTNTEKTVFNYNFQISMDAFFQGVPGQIEQPMPVFATLTFHNRIVRDTKNTVVTLEKGKTKSFVLEFDMQSNEAPFILKPDGSAFFGSVSLKQPVIVNNYRITPLGQVPPAEQISPTDIPLVPCDTDFEVKCKTGPPGYAFLTSCKDNPNKCQSSVVACDSRVDLTLNEYKSGKCGSRKFDLTVQTYKTYKKEEEWDYLDRVIINFWKQEAEKPIIIEKDKKNTEVFCWQQAGLKECEGKSLGSWPYNLPKEKYNVAGCV